MRFEHKKILVPDGEEVQIPDHAMVSGSVLKFRTDGKPPDIEIHYFERLDVEMAMPMPPRNLAS